jgi:hypothetical protein
VSRQVVARAGEVAPGACKIVSVRGREIGQSWCDPKSVRARQFQVTVEAGAALVKGPYVAETFPVSVEEDYLVVELAAAPA